MEPCKELLWEPDPMVFASHSSLSEKLKVENITFGQTLLLHGNQRFVSAPEEEV
jgi:hypothetical protein